LLRLILFLIVAAALAVLAVYLAEHPGAVRIEWGGYEVATSMGPALLAVAAIAVAVTLLYELYRWLRGLPRRIGQHLEHRRTLRGYEAIDRGLIAVAGGDRAAAAWHNRQAMRLLPDRPGTLLLAAQSAQLEGRDDEAYKVFLGMAERKDTELLGLRGLLAQAMKGGDRAEAMKLARRAYRLSPRTPWVLQTLFDLLTRDSQWDEALGILDGIGRERLLDEPVVRRRRAILLHMLAEGHGKAGRLEDALAAARRAVKAAPGFVPAAVMAAELAREQRRRRLARRILEQAWAVEPHPDLARAFLALESNETPTQRYERFKALERIRGEHVETQLAAGELALVARRLDLARGHLERAVALGPTGRACRMMSDLERAAGNAEKAREWLEKSTDARPDHAWVCEETGEAVPAWAPFGPNGGFDVIHWAEPPRVSLLTADTRFLVTAPPPEPRPQAPPAAERPRAPAPDMSTAATD
jgi:HemY protein